MKLTCLPENVAKILQSANSTGTIKQYDSALKRWYQFCSLNQIDCWKPNIVNILSFLCKLYEDGLGYSSINTAKSAISNILGNLDNHSIGQHPLVVKFMKGLTRLRPPTARYNLTWDANVVLEMYKSWSDNQFLDLKYLTLKLVGLLALTSAQRVQTLVSISIKNITWGSPTQIILPNILKCTSISRPNPVIVLNDYTLEPKLCILSCLKEYVSRTSVNRTTDMLLISYFKPYNHVSSQTVSRWLCTSLSMAGVDTSIYKGHSFRHSSTSKASTNGISINSILSRVGWSPKCTTFAKFYNRPLDKRTEFQDAILKCN